MLLGQIKAYTINYSCIQQTSVSYNGGTGVITQDPIFETVGDNDYCLTWNSDEKSPCIDTGDPDPQYNDPDGTRNDMGAYYKDHDVKTYEFPGEGTNNGWKWLSFDILDKTIDPYNIAENMLLPISDPDLLDYALFKDHGAGTNPEEIRYFGGGQWQNGNHEFTSPYGYKFRTENACSLEIPGFRCKETTTFFVAGENEQNWIGYFLKKTQSVYDAFAGYLDNLTGIRTQHWAIKKENGSWPLDIPDYTISPGEMVIVYCEEDIPNFSWVIGTPRQPFNIEVPQSLYTNIYTT